MKIERQAVVVIHGMGEQKPMDTLRSFVKGIRAYLLQKDESERSTNLSSKPDGISNNYETRRLTLTKSRNRPKTDFYEFYWAHNMRDTRFSDIFSWLFKLFFSRKTKVPQRLLKIWYTIWIFTGITSLLALFLFLYIGMDKINSLLSAMVVLPALFSVALWFAKNSVLSSLGDAGRYFAPTPRNVGERNNIRHQGLTFLKKLHEREGEGRYDRIIVVSHSLGSVIAYDLLRLLWTEYHAKHGNQLEIDQSAIAEIETYYKNKKIENINIFQNLQYKCWAQQHKIGLPWLISDFITIGSPLSSADYLIAQNVKFKDMLSELEFPTNPPVPNEPSKKIHFNSAPYTVKGQKRTVKILHHAAVFAVCRWTNIYFSTDFIGGPMDRLFGMGIKNEEVKRKSLWFYPGGHTRYWELDNRESLRKIVNALHLRDR